MQTDMLFGLRKVPAHFVDVDGFMSGIRTMAVSEFTVAADALRAQSRASNIRLREVENALAENRLQEAQESVSRFIEKHPRDPIALNLMAATMLRLARKEEAEAWLARCVATAPAFAPARYEYANLLFQMNKTRAAQAQIEELLRTDPRNPLYLDLQAALLTATGDYAQALQCYRMMVEEFPCSPEIWIRYGAGLRSVGQREECIAAFRKAAELRPACGEAYWSLACLKDYQFSAAEIEQMQNQLARPEVSGEDRLFFHFALGSALDHQGEYARSFENYARGNAIKRLSTDYDPSSLTKHVQACKRLMTAEFFQARAGVGCAEAGPIFIIGMQRAGSTLIEQILASHSAVQATAELPDISLLAEHIGEKLARPSGSTYPEVLASLNSATLRQFGQQYLDGTRSRRNAQRPFFTDKMPYNFLHIGLILLILPNAKIIDARRHPIACCFSNFTMHFKSGPLFGYRLSELGHAYAEYVDLMGHFDRVLPGRVHRIFYEELVRQPESQIHSLLDYLNLPFEEGCLEFHKSERSMDSASSEQVRKPIYDNAIDQWRHYERWLEPLKAALGPALNAYQMR